MRRNIRQRTRGCLARFGVSLVSLAFTLLVLEGVVRTFWPQQVILLRPDIWQPAEVVGWRHAPHVQTTLNTGERTVHVYTDAYGYRIGKLPVNVDDDTFRILALGDSFVEGFQVEYEATFAALLGDHLTAALHRDVVVTNTGVSGWDPNQYFLEAQSVFARETYNLALVFLYMPNDVVSYTMTRFPLRDYAERHTFGWPDHLTRDDLITHWLYPINDTLETRSHLYVWARTQARFLRTRLGLSPYYFPWVLHTDHATASAWTNTANLCASLTNAAAQHEIPVLFVLLPGTMQVDQALLDWYLDVYRIDPQQADWDQPSRILMQELTARDLIVFDTTPGIRAKIANDDAQLYGHVDIHFSPAGHQYIAHLLTDWLLTQHAELLTG